MGEEGRVDGVRVLDRVGDVKGVIKIRMLGYVIDKGEFFRLNVSKDAKGSVFRALVFYLAIIGAVFKKSDVIGFR